MGIISVFKADTIIIYQHSIRSYRYSLMTIFFVTLFHSKSPQQI